MSKGTILTIEDDAPIRRGIADALTFAGYGVLEAGDGDRGMQMATRQEYDLLLLDLVMPGPSGLDILRAVRKTRPTQPVIILTAKGREDDRVTGLEMGADDYVVKPFSVKELVARVEAVLRRTPQRPTDVEIIELPFAIVDLRRCEVRHAEGKRVELSQRERELIRYLARHAGRAIDREELLDNVWGIDPKGVSTRTIDMAIARLREKLGDIGAQPRILLTVRGKGYMFANIEATTTGESGSAS